MGNALINVLQQYSMLTFYEEVRDDRGMLLFCNGRCFDRIELDKFTKYIILKDYENDNGYIMLNPLLKFRVTPVDECRDKVVLSTGNNSINFVCKKN